MPVPAFIRQPAWRFAAVLRDAAEAPRGFLPDAAQQAACWSGFYLFLSWGESPVRAVNDAALALQVAA